MNTDSECGHTTVMHRKTLQRILQSALAAVVALLYGKNLFAVMIRIAMGSSF